jgi:Protein of unknown function (DUF3098)
MKSEKSISFVENSNMKFKPAPQETKDASKREKQASGGIQFPMTQRNYMILALGVLLLIVGYTLMSGGGSSDPKVFDESIFSDRRITVAPIVVLIGYVVIGFSIMYRPKNNN